MWSPDKIQGKLFVDTSFQVVNTFFFSLILKEVYTADALEGESIYSNGDVLIITDVPIDASVAPTITFGGWVKLSTIESEVYDRL